MSVSVVIPTLGRPDYIRRAVDSLRLSLPIPDEVVIVSRNGDDDTRMAVSMLEYRYPEPGFIRSVSVSVPGFVPAFEVGVRAARCDLVAIIDDDVTVSPDWLCKLLAPFSDQAVGIVGGRVLIPGCSAPRPRGRPGQITWYGKHWGNLSSVQGDVPFEVASVQECNWAWRRDLICSLRLPEQLNFDDAIMYGMELCLQARKKGYKTVYNPDALAYHHLAPRMPGLERADRPRRLFGYCRNYTYIMLRHLPRHRKFAFLFWWFLIGERNGWGLGTIIADSFLSGLRWRGEAANAFKAKFQGLRLALLHRL